jgi:hypothetical protein
MIGIKKLNYKSVAAWINILSLAKKCILNKNWKLKTKMYKTLITIYSVQFQ